MHNGIFPIYFITRFNLLNYIYIFFIFLPNPFFSLNFLISLLFICTTLYHHLHSILNLFFIFIIQIFYLPSSTIYKSHNNLDTPPCILLNNSTPTTIFFNFHFFNMFYLSLWKSIFFYLTFFIIFFKFGLSPPINLLNFFILQNFPEIKFIENSSLKTPQKIFLAKPKNNFNFKILFIKDF